MIWISLARRMKERSAMNFPMSCRSPTRWNQSCSGQASRIRSASVSIVRFSGEPNDAPTSQTIKLKVLPMACILFLAEDRCVVAGHDFNPAVFAAGGDGAWALAGQCEVKSAAAAATTKKTGFAAARGMWAAKTSRGQTASDRASDKDALWTKHENCVTDVHAFSMDGNGAVDRFTTSGLDGRLTMWTWSTIAKHL